MPVSTAKGDTLENTTTGGGLQRGREGEDEEEGGVKEEEGESERGSWLEVG